MTSPPWDPWAGAAIGVPWLEAQLAPLGEFGRRHAARERHLVHGDEPALERMCARVMRASEIDATRIAALRSAVRECPDVLSIVARARADEDLDDVDFYELMRFIGAIEAVRALGDERFGEAMMLPEPRALRDALAPGVSAQRTFRLDDAFDAALGDARVRASNAQAEYELAHGRLRARLVAELGIDLPPSDEFILMRDRLPAALPSGLHVVREAATYLLCELSADDAVLRALAAREAAAADVAFAERAVRARLATVVRDSAADIEATADAIGALDWFLARVAFVQRYGGCVPEMTLERRFAIDDARYLPLALEVMGEGRDYVPISLEIADVAVLTGPNMGGKTAALRTCGFIAACLSYAVPPPAARVRATLFDAVAWVGIDEGVTGRSASTLLSSFGREVTALQSILARGAARPLVLVDEFARTTDAREGRALAIALVEILRERGALALIATHVADLARASGAAHYVAGAMRAVPAPVPGETLSTSLRRLAEALDFRIVRAREDAAHLSTAIEIAAVLGLDAELIERARRQLE